MLFTRAQARAVSADDVAGHFGINRTVARSRLDRLAAAGLLTIAFERRSGRTGPGAGRPTKLYSVPPETAAIEFPERHYDRLVGSSSPLSRRRTRGHARERGRGVRSRTWPRTPDSAALVTFAPPRNARARHSGGSASRPPSPHASEDHVTITTPTCPLRPLVLANPEAASIDRGLWIGLVNAHLPARRRMHGERETCDCLDCRRILPGRAGLRKTRGNPGLVKGDERAFLRVSDRRRRHDGRLGVPRDPRARRGRLDRPRQRGEPSALQPAAALEGALAGHGRGARSGAARRTSAST